MSQHSNLIQVAMTQKDPLDIYKIITTKMF